MGFATVYGVGVTVEMVGATAVSVGTCLLIMETLRKTTGIPLSISVLVVPFVVAAGFALAIGIHVYTQLPMLTSAGLLAGALLPVVIFYDRVVATV
ncbi:MAG: hypothetical protein V5A61_03090 [Haloarculaceae archaeon]|jgi:hypothetical protein